MECSFFADFYGRSICTTVDNLDNGNVVLTVTCCRTDAFRNNGKLTIYFISAESLAAWGREITELALPQPAPQAVGLAPSDNGDHTDTHLRGE